MQGFYWRKQSNFQCALYCKWIGFIDCHNLFCGIHDQKTEMLIKYLERWHGLIFGIQNPPFHKVPQYDSPQCLVCKWALVVLWNSLSIYGIIFIGTSQPCFIKKQRTYRCTSYSKSELTKARNWKWRLLCTSSYRCALFSQLRESCTECRALLSISQLLASSAAAVEGLLNILPCRSQKYHDSGAMLAFLQQACPIGNLGLTVLQL